MGRLPVQVVQHITKVQKPLHAPGFLHSGLPVQKRLERDALHIVLHDVNGALILKNVHDPGQHPVVQIFQNIGFRQEVEPGPLGLAHLLHRPAGMEALVLGQVYGGHAASSNDGSDLVCIVEGDVHSGLSLCRNQASARFPAGKRTA